MANRRVVLVNPNRMQPPIGPIGLEYVADALGRREFDLTICDLAFEPDWRTALRRCLNGNDTLAVLVSVRNLDDAYFASQDFILELTAEMIRFIRELSSAPVCLGGVGFSIAPEAVLAFTSADYGIAGDGEEAVPELLDCITANGCPEHVPGAVYRYSDGNIRANPHARCDIASPPAPRRSFFDNRRYFGRGRDRSCERPPAQIRTSGFPAYGSYLGCLA